MAKLKELSKLKGNFSNRCDTSVNKLLIKKFIVIAFLASSCFVYFALSGNLQEKFVITEKLGETKWEAWREVD